MNSFAVVLTLEAQTDILRLEPPLKARILDKLEWMGENAELLHHDALRGSEWAGCYKYRVGDIRIIYQLDGSGNRLVVLKVGHRREVYR